MAFGNARATVHKLGDDRSQEKSLRLLASIVLDAMKKPEIRAAALKITSSVGARDDLGEIEAIFNAVQNGTDAIPGMQNGVRYVNDNRLWDYFTTPSRLLAMCAEGACAEDCDGACTLVCSLLYAIGFRVGVRIYKPAGSDSFEHVYSVVRMPKLDIPGAKKDDERYEWISLDTTVPTAQVGWHPPRGKVKTAYLP